MRENGICPDGDYENIMEEKNLIFIGQRGVGKTTLVQVLCGEELHYHKTQTVQVKAHIIDTPGEFLERRSMNRNLLVSSYDADLVVLVEEADAEQMFFPPGFTAMFPIPAIGVITKIDLHPDYERAEKRLEYAGARTIFPISCTTREGIPQLTDYLKEFGYRI